MALPSRVVGTIEVSPAVQRVSALHEAVEHHRNGDPVPPEIVVQTAGVFEKYLQDGAEDSD